jgi:hypothetical protein
LRIWFPTTKSRILVLDLNGEPIQKFIVVSAENVIFIAFQGTGTPIDFINNL